MRYSFSPYYAALLAPVILFCSSAVTQATPLIDGAYATGGNMAFNDTIGYTFTVQSNPISVSRFGVLRSFYDTAHVGLWNEQGELLASVNIYPFGVLENNFAWSSAFTAPLILNPNTKYRIGSQCNSMGYQEIFLPSATGVTINQFTRSGRSQYVFEFPAMESNVSMVNWPSFSDALIVGPNMDYEVLPEPSTYALLFLGGGVLIWARRRQLRR
jgi:hypothetical protein